jgi:predicted AlkP superfamily pyrophosphatase or phosphodiesterase
MALVVLLVLFDETAGNAAVPGIEHMVIIGCDGMGSIAFKDTNAPVLRRMMSNGASSLRARGVMPTSSSPNWASMIMGAGPEQHGVTSNDWETNKFEIAPVAVGSGNIFPTIFSVMREQRPNAVIACLHDWEGFGRLVERPALNHIEHVKDAIETAGKAADYFKKQKPNLLFVHFDGVDHAGHAFGWKSDQYYKAVELTDSLIGALLEAIEESGVGSKTLVLITADHGGRNKGHGGSTMEEIEIPWILSGPGVARGRQLNTPINTYDTAATVAYVFGLKPPDCWIGKPVLEAFPGEGSPSLTAPR